MGFLDQVRQGAQRTAWEADRMVRQNRANAAVGDARREVDTQIFNLGRAVLESYDAGATPGPEAQPVYEQIQALRAKLQQLEQEVERIKQEQPSQAPGQPAPPPPGQGYAPPPPEQGYAPPTGGYAAPPAQGYAPPPVQGEPFTPPPAQGYAAPGPYTPTGPAGNPVPPAGPYTPTGPAAPPAPPGTGTVKLAGGDPGQPTYDAPTAAPPPDAALAEVTECANCHTPRTDPTALFCQECGTRYSS